MKEIISHRITIAVAAITLVLTSIWYYEAKEYEPLIGIVASLGALISGVFFRQSSTEDNQNSNSSNSTKTTVNGDNNVVVKDITSSNINISTGKVTNPKANKIYNIDKIDEAKFS